MIGDRNPAKAARWLACTLNAGLLAGAVCVVAAEGCGLNRDGAFTVHEAVLVPVRLPASPVHALLQLTPAPAPQLLGVPEAPWPSVAVALSLPLWASSSAACSWSRLGSKRRGPPKATGRPDWPSARRARSRRRQAR